MEGHIFEGRGMRPVTLSFAGIRVLPREARRWRRAAFGQGGGKMGGAFGQIAGKCSVFGARRRSRGVRDGGECGRMGDGKCPFGAMISGGETWKGIFLRGAGCVR